MSDALSPSAAATEWRALTELAAGRPFVVERVRFPQTGIAVEGVFELPELARLSLEDQIFIVAFIKSHGSIKEMEQVFGVSYPTVKARLTRVADSLSFVDKSPDPSRAEILARLEGGEIDTAEAIRRLEEMT